ncbi:hypothetical protein V5799_026285 [Amblyomma americanum]|uniref:ABC-2 type transporter transmembrane domain-containing protein n=1 Tax=Amblyomma americanum TaxID=6943 RepID=A0AAQ4DJ09_AMBAM
MLWYNGQIQHTALLTMSAYNDARLRNVTAVADAQFTFDVTAPPRAKVRSGVIRATGAESDDESEHIRSQNTYRVLLPKVLRSVFFPLVSSFMCSNFVLFPIAERALQVRAKCSDFVFFRIVQRALHVRVKCSDFVLFPIAERALQVKQLHLLTGMSILLYWTLNFIFDFLFYMGTALMVLPPLAYFEELSGTDFRLIFVLNLLHGYAALPFIYIASFLFDNPGYGFTALSILMFVIASVGCLGEVFMEHYASQVNSVFVSAVIGTARQVVRLLPSCSYSRGMTKILQLASENRVCQIGGAELESQCTSTVAEAKLSIQRCCDHIGSPDRTEYVINPFDVHPYSAFYEVVTLSVEGAVLFVVLLFIERWVRKFQRNLGYCPQRDGLLDMLTGVETLTLFIRLRGIEMTQAYMAALLEIFRLEEIAEQQVGKYSLSDVEFLCNRIAILNDGRLQCLGTLTQLKEKFGKGYAITVKTFPDRKQDVVYQRDVAREVVKNFSQAELVYTYEGVLEFRMSRVRMPWSEMFTKMAKIKKRFKLLDFFISDTSLEQIFRSVTRKEAIESAAAAAAQAPQVPVAGHTIATTLGI